jgi:hypothetical protein
LSDDNVGNPGQDATVLHTNNGRGNDDEDDDDEALANLAEVSDGFAPSPFLKTSQTKRGGNMRASLVTSLGHGLRVSLPKEAFDRNTIDGIDENTTFQPPEQFPSKGQLSLNKLQIELDTNRQMHRLAGKYFACQHFWLLFLPSIAITMVSGILSFSSDNPSFASFESYFALSVGCLSVVSIFLQSMIKELDYGHRAKMHQNAGMDLKMMIESLRFDQLDLCGDHAKLEELIRSTKDKYIQVMASCKSVLPTEIGNAYEMAITRMALCFMPPVKYNEDDEDNQSKVEWLALMKIVNSELFNSFSASLLWPLFMPDAQGVVELTMDNLKRELKRNRPPGENHDVGMYELLLQQQERITSINHNHTPAPAVGFPMLGSTASSV